MLTLWCRPGRLQPLHLLSAAEGSRAASTIITLQQLDFAATMAAVLGVPTPFSNIGKVIPELYAVAAGLIQKANDTGGLPCDGNAWLQSYLEALQANSQQVRLNGRCHDRTHRFRVKETTALLDQSQASA